MLTLACLLEEQSAREMLKSLLPRVLPEGVSPQYATFRGKRDLLKNIEARLKGWNAPNTVFLILLDRDREDCRELKERVKKKVVAAGKGDQTCIRIACSELESFYLGDLQAVEQVLSISNLARHQDTKECRAPDEMNGKPSEKLVSLTGGEYSKVKVSRSLGRELAIDGQNRSESFNQLLAGVKKLTG